MDEFIEVRGARQNNLKDISVRIPMGEFVVITGLSGSGKTSLAIDTLYAEGQRRYVESLSSYARQFLGRMSKPDCDYIKGIPPSIAIEQRPAARNPRSTVGTASEIYDYLRMLFARIGRTYSPVSGREVKKEGPEDVVRCMLSREEGTPFSVLAPLCARQGRSMKEQLGAYFKQGFARVYAHDEIVRIEDVLAGEAKLHEEGGEIFLLIDRLRCRCDKETVSRLTDSAETAFYEGGGRCYLLFEPNDLVSFSDQFEVDGIRFEEPTENLFSFNSPIGACPACEGFGSVVGIDERLVVPDTSLSVYEGAVMCWRGEKMSRWKEAFCRVAPAYDFPIFEPYFNLSAAQKKLLWHGFDKEGVDFPCIDRFFDMVRENQYKIQYRVLLSRYRGKTVCPKCGGSRLRKEAGYVKVGGRSITELAELPISDLQRFFLELNLDDSDKAISKQLLTEIRTRLQYLVDVGLSYLTLNRSCNTLSGGEMQRINLAAALGSSLIGTLYVLDEPSIGLHSADTAKLIGVLRRLQQLGNTVIVVEHDEEIIRAADYIIDIGPGAGEHGGEIVFAGTPSQALADKTNTKSYTVRYLTGQETIPLSNSPRVWTNYIDIIGARANNLKGINVRFPLNALVAVTGVSGSGKSTLVCDIFCHAIKRYLDEPADLPGEYQKLDGALNMIKRIELIDQRPIGKSSRSNPVTYVKAYDDIRALFAEQPLARQMGYTPAYFSFNADGGRCEECKGEGTVSVEMQFMADIVVPCPACHGKRFKKDLLDVRFAGANIDDVLNMSVNQAASFFSQNGKDKLARRLKPLQDVGLGYIKLGQPASTLSSGENQRVKLASFLENRTEPSVFVFDEPTTGLHVHDIKTLLAAFAALIDHGHTVIVIEHNLDVIKCADYVIDLGPDGGLNGGYLVACGTPKDIANAPNSRTGAFLRDKLRR